MFSKLKTNSFSTVLMGNSGRQSDRSKIFYRVRCILWRDNQCVQSAFGSIETPVWPGKAIQNLVLYSIRGIGFSPLSQARYDAEFCIQSSSLYVFMQVWSTDSTHGCSLAINVPHQSTVWAKNVSDTQQYPGARLNFLKIAGLRRSVDSNTPPGFVPEPPVYMNRAGQYMYGT